jgi:choline dehydrogenase-like flavoprotein
METKKIDCDVLVVGSGPGGATTAALLAEAGLDVLLLEEGGHFRADDPPGFSLEEVTTKYRNSGLTPTFGPTKLMYIEGRCVGGASEINAALYHLPMPETLLDWKLRYQIDDFGQAELEPYFRETEAEMTVSRLPYALDPASLKLKQGADAMGWRNEEVARFWRYSDDASTHAKGSRQSMSETLVPRAMQAGCRLLPNARVLRFQQDGRRASHALVHARNDDGSRSRLDVAFRDVFVCGGTLQTATLLQRSGLRGRVGQTLRLHPMLRMVARFPDVVNDPSYGVPVQQVVEFKPGMTLGCSHSALPHLFMWLNGDRAEHDRLLANWRNMAIFYVLVVGGANGTVHNIPGFGEPFVTYPMGDQDLAMLGEGLYRLGRMLFEAGAVEFFSPVVGAAPVTSPAELGALRTGLPHGKMSVSTIHLFGTCPMGEDTRRCVVDSFGRMHGFDNLYVNDASILPEATGVNPQATLMAVARRNVKKYLTGR